MDEVTSHKTQVTKMKTILLTGNLGYIGTVMTGTLRRAGYRVVGLDSGWFDRNLFAPIPDEMQPDMQILKDIRTVNAKDLDGIDAVVHLAGLSNDPLGEINPGLTDEINHLATVRLGRLCKEAGCGRFVFASSCSIYGIANTDSAVDEEGALSPITAYAKAKVDAERGLAAMADNRFHPVFMRNATVYGVSARLRLDLVVNNLLAYAYLTGEVSILSDGTPWRPIVHIEDFSQAFLAALEAPSGKVHAQAFNVGLNSENYQVKEIARVVQQAVPGSRVKILNTTGSDERSYRVEFSKIRNALPGFQPRWDLPRGIEQLLEAYRKYGLTREDFESNKYFRIRSMKSLMEAEEVNARLEWTKGA